MIDVLLNVTKTLTSKTDSNVKLSQVGQRNVTVAFEESLKDLLPKKHTFVYEGDCFIESIGQKKTVWLDGKVTFIIPSGWSDKHEALIAELIEDLRLERTIKPYQFILKTKVEIF